MDDEPWVQHWFGDDIGDDLDDAIEAAKPYIYPSRDELLEQLAHANATAIRLRGTAYYDNAHRFVNDLLDTLVGR